MLPLTRPKGYLYREQFLSINLLNLKASIPHIVRMVHFKIKMSLKDKNNRYINMH